MNRKQFLADAARRRLESSNALRRSQTRALERNKSRSSVVADFLAGFTQSLYNSSTGAPAVAAALDKLLQETGVTVENIRGKQGRLLWADHLDPMYNTLRSIITKSKDRADFETVQRFWTGMAKELLGPKLSKLAEEAGFPPDKLGRPLLIVESELGQNSRMT